MAVSLTFFALPRAAGAGSELVAFGWGALLGLSVYGIFDLTNLAILKDYPLPFALMDMAWGTVQYGLTTWLIACKLANV